MCDNIAQECRGIDKERERVVCDNITHTHCMKRKLVAYTRNGFVSGSLINACDINARNTREKARAEQMKKTHYGTHACLQSDRIYIYIRVRDNRTLIAHGCKNSIRACVHNVLFAHPTGEYYQAIHAQRPASQKSRRASASAS